MATHQGAVAAPATGVHGQFLTVNNALKLLMALFFLGLCGLIAWTLRDTTPREGSRAPEFSIVTSSGQRITPTSFGGKVLVLNFWATWCPPCLQELPSLNEFQRQFAGSGVVVVGVSIDKNEQKYRRFLQHVPLAFQTARDGSADIANRYGTFQYPETYVIKDGRIVRKYAQAENWTSDEIAQFVHSLL